MFESLVAAIRELNYPTEGETAVALWQWLSSSFGPPAPDAKRIYLELGYVPFCGYPLVRKA